jgi:4-hydroxybenzoate polyprenyltransferase
MLHLILFSIFLIVVLFVLGIGFLINYHFKKLGIDNDRGAEKIMKIYKNGVLIISLISIISLILSVFIK